MKKKLVLILISLIMSLSFMAFLGCEKKEYTVEFYVVYELEGLKPDFVTSKKVKEGDLAIKLPNTKNRNWDEDYIGWYQEPQLLTPWAFYTDRVYSDIKLYTKNK